MNRTLLLLAVLVAVATAPAGKPSIELHVSPPVAFAPAELSSWAKIVDPEGALVCPVVVWTWGDGTASKRVPNCDPYALPENVPREWIADARHTYHFGGDFVVRVEVSTGQVELTTTRAIRLLSRAGE